MPVYKSPVTMTVAGTTFTFRKRVVEDLPDAAAFLESLLARQTVSPPVAAHYVKLASRLKRQGRLADVTAIVHNVERTAANAYLRWQNETYETRIAAVTRVLGVRLKDRAALKHVRVHSLVPPIAGKQIPRVALPGALDLDSVRHLIGQPAATTPQQLQIEWVASSAWTLHVAEKRCAPHQDPCADCVAIELDASDLEVIASAFEKAWGHRELAKVPQDAYLFGAPPPESATNGVKPKCERIAALVGPGVTSDELIRINARAARDVDAFVARLQEGAEGVYISREACNGRLADVIQAVWQAWQG